MNTHLIMNFRGEPHENCTKIGNIHNFDVKLYEIK